MELCPGKIIRSQNHKLKRYLIYLINHYKVDKPIIKLKNPDSDHPQVGCCLYNVELLLWGASILVCETVSLSTGRMAQWQVTNSRHLWSTHCMLQNQTTEVQLWPSVVQSSATAGLSGPVFSPLGWGSSDAYSYRFSGRNK